MLNMLRSRFVLVALFSAMNVAGVTAAERVLVDVGQLPAEACTLRDARVQPATTTAGRLQLATGHKNEWPGISFKPAEPWDLSGFAEIVVEVKNLGDTPAPVGLRIDSPGLPPGKPGAQRTAEIAPGATATLAVRLPHRLPEALKGKLFGMRGLPFGWSEASNFDSSRTSRVEIFCGRPKADHLLEISSIRVRGTALAPPAGIVDRLFPLIDKYGQFIHGEWPGKTHSDADLANCRQAEAADLAAHPGPSNWDVYGGWQSGPQLQATGYFRAEKVQGRWWLVDPEGRLFWSHGIDCVRGVTGATPITDREHWFAELPPRGEAQGLYSRTSWAPHGYYQGKTYEMFAFSTANLQRKFGPQWETPFAELVHRRLRSWGLNTIANWSDAKIYGLHKTPYTATANADGPLLEGSTGYWGKFRDVFDPGFGEGLRKRLARDHAAVAGDPWCIGFFIDNELGWGDDTALPLATLASPAKQVAKQVLVADLKAKYASIAALNTAWGTQHASWEALLESQTPPDKKRAAEDLKAFTVKFAEMYFRTCRDAVRRHAPQHLYFGCRFAWVNELAARAAAKYCDVMSYNLYRDSVADFRLPEGVDKPVLIGEFHFGALDRGMFHTGLRPVANQEARAKAYASYVRGALANPCFVGSHWFQFADQATTGRGDGENYQIGFVDIADTPYPETIAASRAVGAELYQIRAK